jgi:hypothetical protein
MYATASRQACAQSMSSWIQRAILATSGSLRQAEAQWSQARAQSLQASMQDLKCSWAMAHLLEHATPAVPGRSRDDVKAAALVGRRESNRGNQGRIAKNRCSKANRAVSIRSVLAVARRHGKIALQGELRPFRFVRAQIRRNAHQERECLSAGELERKGWRVLRLVGALSGNFPRSQATQYEGEELQVVVADAHNQASVSLAAVSSA